MKHVLSPRMMMAVSGLAAVAVFGMDSADAAAVPDHKAHAVQLLKSHETREPQGFAVVSADKYTQHDLYAPDGKAGLDKFLEAIPKEKIKIRTVRVFQDGVYVFTQSEYEFFGRKAGFDVFRFDGDKIVEHWDNLQENRGQPNVSGHTMLDGPTEVADLGATAANKAVIAKYMDDVVNGHEDKLPAYFSNGNLIQHDPNGAGNLSGRSVGIQALAKLGTPVKYSKVVKVLGQGNFVLVMSSGTFGDKDASYYDMYRLQAGKIAEHWGTTEVIPPRAEWKNSNGKF